MIECEELSSNAQRFWIKFNKQKMPNNLNNQPKKGLIWIIEVAFKHKNCNQPTTEITTISDKVDQVKDVLYIYSIYLVLLSQGSCY